MTQTGKLIASAVVMSVILVGITAHHAWRRASGTEVRLEMTPFDPRDPWMGYYSRIGTPLARLDLRSLDGEDSVEPGDFIYVVLNIDEAGSAQPVAVHRNPPDAALFIRGLVRSVGNPVFDDAPLWVRADYNIERYYASAEDARALDAHLAERRDGDSTGMRLILSLAPDGQALIKGIEMDGETRYDRLW